MRLPPLSRLLVLVLLLGALAPGTWLRSPPPPPDNRPILAVTPLAPAPVQLGDMTLEGLWHLTSPNSMFGSYSALVLTGDGRLLAASDRGALLSFAIPPARFSPRFGWLAGDAAARKTQVDVEAMTRDPATGRIWAAFEGTNAVERFPAALDKGVSVRPPELQKFGSNSGPEAFARLADGRFIALSEGPRERFGTVHTGVVFAGDPVDGARGQRFAFIAPDGFRPVDMAQIPDGRVLVLLRRLRFSLSPGFESALMLADPTGLTKDSQWRGTLIGTIIDPEISDNYEGLAIAPHADGSLALWLISDDNDMSYQRSLLARLRWMPPPPAAR